MPRPELITRVRNPPMGVNHQLAPWGKPAQGFVEDMEDVEIARTADGLMFETRKAFSTVVGTDQSTWYLFNPAGITLGAYLHFLGEWIEIDSDTGAKTSHPLLFFEGLTRVIKRNLHITAGVSDLYVDVSADALLIGTTEGASDVVNSSFAANFIEDVIDDITGAGLTAQVDGAAVREAYVDGAQAGVFNITVDDGAGGAHSLAVGDIVSLSTSPIVDYLVTDVSSTTISIEHTGSGVTLSDNFQIKRHFLGKTAQYFRVGRYFIGAGTTTKVPFYDFVPAHQPGDGGASSEKPFPNTEDGVVLTEAERGLDTWRHLSVENAAGCAYFAAALEASTRGLLKYDGQNVYRAGLPKGVLDSAVMAGSGTGVDAGNHDYAVTYEFVDNQGNTIEGEMSDRTTLDVTSAEDVTVTVDVDAIAPSTTYFMNNYALVVGNQAGVTDIDVDDGSGGKHTLHVGDTIYLYDQNAGEYITRTVDAAQYDGGSGRISISGAAIDVNDDDPISVNLRIKIWRSAVGGTDLYLVATIVPDLSASTTVYTDSTSDSTLTSNTKYVSPTANELHTLLDIVPNYLRLHEGSLVAAGSFSNPNAINPSVPGLPEYFPATLQSEIGENANDIITGLGKSGEFLVIGKQNSLWTLFGPILDEFNALPAFRISLLSEGIGAVSHQSMVTSGETLYVLSDENIYPIRNGQMGPLNEVGEPIGVGLPVYPLFKNKKNLSSQRLLLNRACAVQHKGERFLMFNLPNEEALISAAGDGSALQSLVLVYFMNYGVWGVFGGAVGGAGFTSGAIWTNDGLFIANLHTNDDSSDASLTNYVMARSETGVDSLDYSSRYFSDDTDLWTSVTPTFRLLTAPEFANEQSPDIPMILKRLRVYSGHRDVTPSFDYLVDIITDFQGDGGGFSGTFTSRRENIHRFRPQRCRAVQLQFTMDTSGSSDNYKFQLSGWQLEAAVRGRPRLGLEERASIT